MRLPFRKEKQREFQDELTDQNFSVTGGIRSIRNTSQTKLRIDATDQEIVQMINDEGKMIGLLCNEKPINWEEVHIRENKVKALRAYRMYKTSGSAFTGAGDNRDAAERLRAAEQTFWSCIDIPEAHEFIMMVLQHNANVSYTPFQVAPSAEVLIQAQPAPQYSQVDGLAESTRTEKVSRNPSKVDQG